MQAPFVLANYLIGLREGLEAALVVGILVSYATKIGRRDLLPRMWVGVGLAVTVSLLAGVGLTWGPYGLSFQAQEIIGGVLSLAAVGLVTWMIFWMAGHARGLASDLRTQVDASVLGTGAGIVVIAAVTVGREGLETALFIWATVATTGNALIGAIGAILGILTAVIIAFLISKGFVRIDLGRFFRWTGVFLVIVAAGVLAYAFGELQEAAVLPGWGAPAFSLAAIIPPTSWYGALLAGIFGITPEPTWLQTLAWVTYVAVVLPLFLVRSHPPREAVKHSPVLEVSRPTAPATSPAITKTKQRKHP